MNLYPLVFTPRFVEKIWGGRKLQTILNKELPADKLIGESWELYDFPPGGVDKSTGWVSSVVSNGPLAGKSLHQLIIDHQKDLLGRVAPTGKDGVFPLLIKFLDAREDLSVQVHPDEKYAANHPNAHLKTEAWYVIQRDENARLLKGLVAGSNREKFTQAIQTGDVESHIQSIIVKPGDCHYLPSGTVHALGAGILVAEVQTPSDTTYRVHDFNRIDASTGKLRDLHVDQALECMDFTHKPVDPGPRNHIAGPHSTVSRLVTSSFFAIEKVRFTEGVEQPLSTQDPVIWIMLEGAVQLTVEGYPTPTVAQKGQTLLLPASMKNPVMKTLSDSQWLEVTFPA